MKRRLFAFALTLCLTLGILAAAGGAQAETYDVYVVSNTLKVYAKVSTASRVLGTLSYGEKMTCLATNSGWAAVRNDSGAIGYCKTGGLSTRNPNDLNVKAYITASNVPVYRKPDTSSGVMMRVKKNSSYTAVAVTQDGDWVRLKNGKYYGYVQAKYVSRSAADDGESALNTSVYISVNTVQGYDRPSTSGKVMGTLCYGEKYTLISVSGDWAYIQNAAGRRGYCQTSALTTKDPNAYSQMVYAAQDGAKVYKKPLTSSGVMKTLERGEGYLGVARTPDGEWLRLKNGGSYGYVQAKYFSITKPDAPLNTSVYISVNTVQGYDRPSTSGKVMGTLCYGEKYTLISVSGDWAYIQNAAGRRGYCQTSALTTKDPNAYSQMVYAAQDGAKVYKKPLTSSGVMKTLERGEGYLGVARTPDGEWLRLKNGGSYGYVQAKYFSTTKPDASEPESVIYVGATTLKVYKRPDSGSGALGTVCFGESMTLLSVDDGWACVRNAAGAVGYCSYGGLTRTNPNSFRQALYAAKDGVKLYSKPLESASVAATLKLNASVMAVAKSEDGRWLRILLDSGSHAYARTEDLSLEKIPEDNSPIQDVTPVTVYITDTNLNFYTSNSSQSTLKGTLSFGERLRCTGRGEGWARVENDNGSVGYCLESGLSTKDPNTYNTTLYAQADGVRVYQRAQSASTVLATLNQNAKATGVAVSPDKDWIRLYNGTIYGYARASDLATSPVESEAENSTINAIVTLARSLQGIPYKYAAQSPSDGFDCSGFTYYVYKNAAGVTLKRTAKTQGYNDSYPKIASRGDLKVGDLVFFDTVSDDGDLCDHVGIYLGGNQFIHASSAKGEVTISSLGSSSSDYYYRTYSWGRRIIG